MAVARRRRRRRRFGLSAVAGGVALSSDAVFTLRDVVKTYSAGGTEFRLTVRHLELARGARVAFIGESGSGKSTLLELLAMILRPTSCGEFRFRPAADAPYDVARIWEVSDADELGELRSRHIGYVLQYGGLLPYMSVRDNVNLSRRLLGLAVDATADELAERLGIDAQLDKLPSELSVGQRQRAAIARALAHSPPIVIADEPTAAVDPVNAERILRMLTALVDDLGVTLVLSTHAHQLIDKVGIAAVPLNVAAADAKTMSVTVEHG